MTKLIDKEHVREILCEYIPQILDASEDEKIRRACAGILSDVEKLKPVNIMISYDKTEYLR